MVEFADATTGDGVISQRKSFGGSQRPVAQDDDGGADDGIGHERTDRHELDQLLDIEQERHQGTAEAADGQRHQRHLRLLVYAAEDAEEEPVLRHSVDTTR